MNHALESNNAEMTKRLKYTKDILTHMLNNNNRMATGSGVGGSTTGMSSNTGAGPNTASSRMQTLGSAMSSKRTIGSAVGDTGMPSSVTGRIGSSTNVNLMSSDRRPLNVLN